MLLLGGLLITVWIYLTWKPLAVRIAAMLQLSGAALCYVRETKSFALYQESYVQPSLRK